MTSVWIQAVTVRQVVDYYLQLQDESREMHCMHACPGSLSLQVTSCIPLTTSWMLLVSK